jgi:hypothetical protein
MLLSDRVTWISDCSESTFSRAEIGSSFLTDRDGCPDSPPDADELDDELLLVTIL